MSDIKQSNYENHWYEETIHLKRPSNGDTPLGITIAGGIDNPTIDRRFTSIIIVRIFENGLAHRDQQLKLYDIILSVDDIDLTNMKHKHVLNALRTSGEKVKLLIRRLLPPCREEINVKHNGELGITTEGGLESEYFQKDYGIFIKSINAQQTNNRLRIGDRLLQISSAYNTYDLRFVTQKDAEEYIKSACAQSPTVTLYVGHITPITRG